MLRIKYQSLKKKRADIMISKKQLIRENKALYDDNYKMKKVIENLQACNIELHIMNDQNKALIAETNDKIEKYNSRLNNGG